MVGSSHSLAEWCCRMQESDISWNGYMYFVGQRASSSLLGWSSILWKLSPQLHLNLSFSFHDSSWMMVWEEAFSRPPPCVWMCYLGSNSRWLQKEVGCKESCFHHDGLLWRVEIISIVWSCQITNCHQMQCMVWWEVLWNQVVECLLWIVVGWSSWFCLWNWCSLLKLLSLVSREDKTVCYT